MFLTLNFSSLIEVVHGNYVVNCLLSSPNWQLCGLGESINVTVLENNPQALYPHATGDLKVKVLLDAFTHANCSACSTDSNAFEQIFDKLLVKALRFFSFFPCHIFFLLSLKQALELSNSFTVAFRVECMIKLALTWIKKKKLPGIWSTSIN